MIYNRLDFKNYCLRALGAPVLEINVDNDQVEDRIDEALEYWRLYHHEGIEKIYLKQRINASYINLTTNNAEAFTLGTIITGQTSHATARVINELGGVSSGNKLIIRLIQGVFSASEAIVSTEGIVGVLAATDFYIVGESENKYITVPDLIYGISRVLPFSGTQMSSRSMFDIQYQLRLNDLYDLSSTSIIYYSQVMSHLALLALELNGKPMHRFNRLSNKLYIDTNWEENLIPGSFVVVEAYRAMDPTVVPRIWNEILLKHYGTALIKRTWAVNLKKFSGLQLPGGVSLDGQGMYDEAMNEIRDIEEKIENQSPLEWFVG